MEFSGGGLVTGSRSLYHRGSENRIGFFCNKYQLC
jgi:hypothetical protein